MIQQENQHLILGKIAEVLEATAKSHSIELVKQLDQASRIFIAGAGRSRLVGSFFAMRLMHGGYNVSLVGEITTPCIRAGDLLIIISGSGETEQLISFTKKAVSIGADVILITAKLGSTIGGMAGAVFPIGTTACYKTIKGMPMGTVFELSTLCFLEALIAHVILEKGIAEEEMQSRHANLE